jgi:hypothetical protein
LAAIRVDARHAGHRPLVRPSPQSVAQILKSVLDVASLGRSDRDPGQPS